MSGRGAGAVGRNAERESGVFPVPGAAAEDPARGQRGSVHLYPRYRQDSLENDQKTKPYNM